MGSWEGPTWRTGTSGDRQTQCRVSSRDRAARRTRTLWALRELRPPAPTVLGPLCVSAHAPGAAGARQAAGAGRLPPQVTLGLTPFLRLGGRTGSPRRGGAPQRCSSCPAAGHAGLAVCGSLRPGDGVKSRFLPRSAETHCARRARSAALPGAETPPLRRWHRPCPVTTSPRVSWANTFPGVPYFKATSSLGQFVSY